MNGVQIVSYDVEEDAVKTALLFGRTLLLP